MWWFLIVASVLALISMALFSVQGGFGGGHGSFDLVIFAAGLPWSLLHLSQSDFLSMIAAPFVLNVTSILLIAAIVKTRLRMRRK